MKFRYRARQGNLLSLLVNQDSLAEVLALDYLRLEPTYKLKATTRNFTLSFPRASKYSDPLPTGNFTISGSANIVKYDSVSTFEATLNPPEGWAYVDITSVSTDERSVFYANSGAIGYQVAYQTTTTTSQSVSIAANGLVTIFDAGTGTFNYRIHNGTNWSAEFIFDQTITITTLDIDDQITVAQTGATIAGTNLIFADAARVRYSNIRLSMQAYSPSASPTFNVPNLTEFFNSGMPLGSVTFDLLRTV